MITTFHSFAGMGGDAKGAVDAGATVVAAANHSKIAIATHAANHPNADHYVEDLMQIHPSVFPKTDIFWASPVCTSHTGAKGVKIKDLDQLTLFDERQIDPKAEMQRLTMREVIDHAAWHRNEIVIVENVVEVTYWRFYNRWINEMVNLGYKYQTLYLNSMFFGVPQSRDRWYTVFWRGKAPNLDFRPESTCPTHGKVRAIQNFKNTKVWGRYNKQYTYNCPICGKHTIPALPAAETVIDWSLPINPVKSRKKPFVGNTIARIREGLQKYTVPFLMSYYGRDDAHKVISEPMPTVPTANRHTLVIPAFITHDYGSGGSPKLVSNPMGSILTKPKHRLVIPQLDKGTLEEMVQESLVRFLTTQELKLGMGFPEDYIILGNSTQRKQQLGNAVTPPTAKEIIKRCIESLEA